MDDIKTLKIPGNTGIEFQYYVNDAPDVLEPARVYPTHIHDCLEIYFLIEGSVGFMVDGRVYTLRPGDAVFSRPNEVHHCILTSETVHRQACFWFLSDDEFLFGPFLHGSSGSGSLLSPQSEKERADALRTVRGLEQLPRKSALSEYSQIVGLLDLWHGCLNISGAEETLPAQLKLILEDISGHLPEIHSLSYLTEKYYLSPAQLRRLFYLHLRTTPKAYIESKRLAFSCTLLRAGAGVTEACMEAGFPDLSNYIKLFRDRFGITPSDYRSGKDSPVMNKYI